MPKNQLDSIYLVIKENDTEEVRADYDLVDVHHLMERHLKVKMSSNLTSLKSTTRFNLGMMSTASIFAIVHGNH